MNYFRAYSLGLDETIIAAWDSQVAEAEQAAWLANELARKRAEIFSCFSARYAELCELPRGARREIQRRLACADELPFPTDWRRKVAQSLAGSALLLALTQMVQAATINVTTRQPVINGGDGKCSLIEAIINANDDAATHGDCPAGSGADIIVLPTNKTHTLSSSYPYTLNGLPAITSQITIVGRGGKIARDPAAQDFRLIAVSGSGNLTLKDVTLSGGSYAGNGGGIANAGYLTIENGTVSGNSSGGAGGGLWNLGSVTIKNSTIRGNTAAQFNGGGVNNFGTITIVNSVISGNSSLNMGGGINNGSSGVLSLRRSRISGNTGYRGGGIFNYGFSTIEKSNISQNTASENGGGIANYGYGTVATSVITNSLISRNQGQYGGAGIHNSSGSVTIHNSTISGNTSDGHHGGGILNFLDGTLTLRNGTISGNIAGEPGSGVYGRGGGIYNRGSLYLHRSLISGNKALYAGSEVYNSYGVVSVTDYNILGFNGNGGVVGFVPGSSDIVPAENFYQIVGPLANNGGPTKTHALVNNSPGIDAVPLADPNCIGTDQRGVHRPKGGGCDIGAFEREADLSDADE